MDQRSEHRNWEDSSWPRQKSLEVGNGQDQPRKRRKIALACDQCRIRKSRCDGIKPVCGECSQRGNRPDPCRYKTPSQKDPAQDEQIRNLLERVRELEHRESLYLQGRDLDLNRPDEGRTDSAPENQQAFRGVESDVRVKEASVLSSTLSSMVPPPDVPQSAPEEVSPVDAMGANSTIDPPEQENDDRYYGSSSAVSFMHQVYKTILNGIPLTGTNSANRNTARQPPTQGGEKFWTLRRMEHLSLLPRPLMDRALDCYWARIYHLYPFIHKRTFMRAYEQLWISQPADTELQTPGAALGGSVEYGPNSIVFHCALNMMLALATQFMDTPLEDRRRLGDLFAEKARNLCQLDLFDDGSLAVIQTLLLMTQYLQSTPFPNRCWNCIGIACRMAQGLGLYVENSQSMKRFSPLEIEMRRRVWYGCVILDAVVSMTLGRPLMLDKYQQIPLPRAIDDEYLADPDSQPAGHISWVHFYVQSIKLYGMLADVISQMYANTAAKPTESLGFNDKGLGSSSSAFILEMDSAISEFERQIPDHLHWDRRESLPANVKAVNVFAQQSSVLLVRFLHLRILLYRPAFTRYCQHICAQEAVKHSEQEAPHHVTDVSLVVARGLSMACVENSIRLIEQVHLRSTTTATGAWWYNLFYARTAGIVVLLAMVCDSIVRSIGWTKLTDAWIKCKTALSSLQIFSLTVVRCLRGLERLHHHILNFRNGSGPVAGMDSNIGLNGFNTAGQQNSTKQTLDDGHDQFFVPIAQDWFGDDGDFDWPNDLEASMLDNIFSLEVINP
ncbi:uncharacterized protein Z518_07523 [Rhinocladiella mackenziei CBS 650.93]|uniref:Zn(2)-C6 fungal-type domain-containing protein n=1 Tax=Rhinocladiella mackenziei CBS 650.93 TaxID=1442369 RepID=A0A0D2J4Q1_9EURO|nr:uncharacterized protein Z518_07523 [Rhinocladiella mackenziei CBS 650.93]KIX03970.1 hypothetical protein Z518_07523 [Rhinocladiella mackenziei CBS 650.93]